MTESSVSRNRMATGLLMMMVALCAVYCGLAANRMYPLIDGDGLYFFPPAIEWSEGRAFANPVVLPALGDPPDGTATERYTYHGFLYPLLVGAVGRWLGGGAVATVAAAYIVHWAAASLAALAVWSWVLPQAQVPGRRLLAIVLPPSMLALSVAWHGRIEPLAIGLVSAAALAWRWPRPWHAIIGGLSVGFLAFTSPAIGLVGGAVLIAALAMRPDRAIWTDLVAAAIGTTAAAVAAVALYPYPFNDWIAGFIRHSRAVMTLPPWQGFFDTWVTRAELPLLGLSCGLLLIGAGARVHILVSGVDGRRKLTALLLLIIAIAAVAELAVVKTEASYNAVVWMPLLACVAVTGRPSRRQAGLVVAALLLPCVGLLRSSIVLAGQFEPGVVGFAEARARLRELAPTGCAVSPGLWMAAGSACQIVAGAPDQSGAILYVRQETYTGTATPPEFEGYRLVENRFARATRVFDIPVARTAGGWQIAVYRKQSTQPAGSARRVMP